MARAKRTDRAEARRRYRASIAEGGARDEGPAEGPGAAASAKAPGAPVERPSIGRAFRAAYRPARISEDLRYLPTLIRSKAVLVPAAITIASTVLLLTLAPTGASDVVSGIVALAAQYFVVTPPIGAIFLAGYLAPRASYLAGAIVGLVAALCVSLAVTVGGVGAATPSPGASPSASPSSGASASPSASAAPSASSSASAPASVSPSGSAVASASVSTSAGPSASPAASAAPGTTRPPASAMDVIGAAFVVSPIAGLLFAAAAAWYRRFLTLANPNRGQRPPQRGRPNQRRR